MLPLAQAAYDVARGDNPVLPTGFNITGKITVDQNQFLVAMATAVASQRRMMDAMKVDGNIFGVTAVNAATKTVVASFRGTQTLEDWLADLDFVAIPYSSVKDAGNVHMGFQLVYNLVRDSVPTDARTSGSQATAWAARSLYCARPTWCPMSTKRSCPNFTPSQGPAWPKTMCWIQDSRPFSTS